MRSRTWTTSIDDLGGADPGVAIVRGGGAPDELEALVPVVVEAAVAAGRPTVAADVFEEVPEGPGRGEELVDSLSEDLREQIALVDDAERTEGQVGVVLALDAVAAGVDRALRHRRRRLRHPAGVDTAVTPAPPGARTMTTSVAGMGAAAALSRAFGGLRVVVIAAVLGTTYLGNTFQASNSVSNVLFELLAAGALSAVLVPTFVDLLDRGRPASSRGGGRRRAVDRARSGLAVVTLLGILLAPQIARLLTAGVDDPAIAAQQEELATYLLRFFVPQVLLYALGAVATAVLHARRSFVLPAVAPIGNTVVLVAALGIFHAMAGSDPGLDLSEGERLCLALGGTLGRGRLRGGAGDRAARHRLPLPAAARGERSATPRCATSWACRVGPPSSTPAPGSCWRRR